MDVRAGGSIIVASPLGHGAGPAASTTDVVENPPAAVDVDGSVVGQGDVVGVDACAGAVAGVVWVVALVEGGGGESEGGGEGEDGGADEG